MNRYRRHRSRRLICLPKSGVPQGTHCARGRRVRRHHGRHRTSRRFRAIEIDRGTTTLSQLDAIVLQAKLDVTPEGTSVAHVYPDRGVVLGVLPFAGNGPGAHWRDLISVFGHSSDVTKAARPIPSKTLISASLFQSRLEELARFSQANMDRDELGSNRGRLDSLLRTPSPGRRAVVLQAASIVPADGSGMAGRVAKRMQLAQGSLAAERSRPLPEA